MAYKYLIFETLEAAEAKNVELFARMAVSYPIEHAKSQGYCTIIKHYTLDFWAVYIDLINFPNIFTAQEIADGQPLNSEWYSQEKP